MRLLGRALLAASIVTLTSLPSYTQSSKNGSFHGKTFSDNYFKIAFDLPPFLDPQTASATNIHAQETADAWMMAVAREGKEPYGIQMISQHLTPGGITSAQDFLRRVRNSRSPDDIMGASGHQLEPSGLTFHWLDWREASGTRNSAVVTQRGDYLIVARCSAKNDEELQAIKNALFGMRVISK
jgi:hypothetical protein